MWSLISVMQLERMLREQQKMTLVDLRDEVDYELGHIPGAVSMASDRLDDMRNLEEPVILICYRGPESMQMARRLAETGMQVFAVCGGMNAWRQH